MSKIDFSKAEKEIIVQKLQKYFKAELGQDIGQFAAEFLLDFFSEEVGPYYYNKGLHDTRSVLASRFEEITEAIYIKIELPPEQLFVCEPVRLSKWRSPSPVSVKDPTVKIAA